MKKNILFFLFLLVLFACNSKREDNHKADSQLKILVPEEYFAEDFWNETAQDFENTFSCKINLEKFADSQQILDSLKTETADLILGMNNSLLVPVLRESVLVSYKPTGIYQVKRKFIFDESYHLIPYDFCYLAVTFNEEEISFDPQTFGEMQDGKWENKIIVSNPLESGIGKAVFLWSVATFNGNGFGHFWRSIKNNLFAVTSTQREAYDLFLAGEAPIVLSESTFENYLNDFYPNKKYSSFIPEEGGFLLIEAVGILESSQNKKLAEQFVEYLLTEEFQKKILRQKYKYPVNENLNFEPNLSPEIDVTDNLSLRELNENYFYWLKRWKRIMKK